MIQPFQRSANIGPSAKVRAELAGCSCAAHAAGYKVCALARNAGLGARQFRRRFEAEFHVSPKAFFARAQADAAAKALARGIPPKEVAFLFHYSDPSHLGRALKRHFRATPAEIAAHHGRKEGARGNAPPVFARGSRCPLCSKRLY